jgi:uncharacterized damage-inducible protein DinB
MKRFGVVVFGICVIGLPAMAGAQAPAPAAATDQNPYTAAAMVQFKVTSGYVAKAAEKMPEEQYAFKPTPEVRSFGQLVGHLADANYMFCSKASGDENPSKESIEKTKTAKADLVKALNDAMAYCEGVLGKMDDKAGTAMVEMFGRQQPKLGLLWFNTVHNYEHYGNMVTYMRMKGLVPPSSEKSGM